jgi:hypothetical protein
VTSNLSYFWCQPIGRLSQVFTLDICLLIAHNITQQHDPSKYDSEMLGVQFEYESPCATFQASQYYITRAHVSIEL